MRRRIRSMIMVQYMLKDKRITEGTLLEINGYNYIIKKIYEQHNYMDNEHSIVAIDDEGNESYFTRKDLIGSIIEVF